MRRFQRARSPDEKEVRREAILGAARDLLDEVSADAFGLNELARRAKISKPNVYRYFESREHVLLELWVEELRAVVEDAHKRCARVERNDVDGVVRALVRALVARPRACELISIVSSVIERNVSGAAIVRAKTALLETTQRVAAVIHERLPRVSLVDAAYVASCVGIFVAGVWPATKVLPAEVRADPVVAATVPRFGPDLTRFLTTLIKGVSR